MRICVTVILTGLLLAPVAPFAYAQTTQIEKKVSPPVRASSVLRATPGSSTTADRDATGSDRLRSASSVLLSLVPNVAGLSIHDAEDALVHAGIKAKEIKEIYDEQPDSSLPFGYVRVTEPVAGTPLAGIREIRVHIPRAASAVGFASIGVNDAERRDGFDLDEQRYEEIFRGADFVVRVHEDEPYTETNGRIAYRGAGLFVEPSDGAVLFVLEPTGGDGDDQGLGSYRDYVHCKYAMENPKISRVPAYEVGSYPVQRHGNAQGKFCVLTSKHAIAVVEFRATDNRSVSDYKFYFALFPAERLTTPMRKATTERIFVH